jgi:hypothetical protein
VSGTYVGTLASGNGTSGVLSVTIDQNAQQIRSVPTTMAATYTVTGTLIINGNQVIVLTGTFDGTTLVISGNNFSFNGTLSSGTLSGTFSGPNGASGSFTVSQGSNGNTVKVYTGTFSGDETGTLNLVVNGTTVSGVAVETDGSAHLLTGTVNGTTISVNGGTVTGTMSQDGNSCTGNWNNGQTGANYASGQWTAAVVSVNIKTYVGTVTGTDGVNAINGVLRIAVNGTTVGAIITGVSSNPVVLTGSTNGTDVKLMEDGVEVASGSFTNNGNNCNGNWNNGHGGSGTWQATLVP